MTPTEKLILENQIAIMRALSRWQDWDENSSLDECISKTKLYLNESDGSGE